MAKPANYMVLLQGMKLPSEEEVARPLDQMPDPAAFKGDVKRYPIKEPTGAILQNHEFKTAMSHAYPMAEPYPQTLLPARSGTRGKRNSKGQALPSCSAIPTLPPSARTLDAGGVVADETPVGRDPSRWVHEPDAP